MRQPELRVVQLHVILLQAQAAALLSSLHLRDTSLHSRNTQSLTRQPANPPDAHHATSQSWWRHSRPPQATQASGQQAQTVAVCTKSVGNETWCCNWMKILSALCMTASSAVAVTFPQHGTMCLVLIASWQHHVKQAIHRCPPNPA